MPIDLVDQPGQIDRLGIELELPGLDLGEVEHLVDEAEQVGAGGIHAAQRFLRLVRAEPRRVGDHHLGQPDDGVERGAQLVAHAGEELRLVLARLRELAALLLDLVEQPRILDRQHRLRREGLQELDRVLRRTRPAPCGEPPGLPRSDRRRAREPPDGRDNPDA